MGPPSQFANPEGTVPDLHTMQQRFVNQDSPTAFTSLQILVSWLQNPRNKPREEASTIETGTSNFTARNRGVASD